MEKLHNLIRETYNQYKETKKIGCSCGCNTCGDKKPELKESIKALVRKILKESPQPQTKPGVKEPDTKPVQPKPKRRTLQPDREKSPDTKPKASLKEDEKEIVNKIVQRFKKLK